MRVYHFTNEKAAFSIIRGRSLRASRVKSVNDPFELMAFELPTRERREGMQRLLDHVDANFGFLSLSANWQNPVQWAHYADNHHGVCLGFDVNDDLLAKVDYTKDRVSEQAMVDALAARDEALVTKFLFTKFEHWAYEDERRIICRLDTLARDGHHYVNFSPDVRLREVIVGARNDTITKKHLIGALNGLSGVDYFRARAAFRSFKMVRQLDPKLGLR